MQKGAHIKDYQNEILIFEGEITIKIKNRVLKHIVEKRKQDNYTEEDLLKLFTDIFDVLESNNFKIVDNKDRNDNIFLLFELVVDKTRGVVLVLEIVKQSENHYFIKTGFYRSAKKLSKLLQQTNEKHPCGCFSLGGRKFPPQPHGPAALRFSAFQQLYYNTSAIKFARRNSPCKYSPKLLLCGQFTRGLTVVRFVPL